MHLYNTHIPSERPYTMSTMDFTHTLNHSYQVMLYDARLNIACILEIKADIKISYALYGIT